MERKIKNICFTGHRPNKLPRDVTEIKNKTKELCLILIFKFGYRGFITGGANGYDTICFYIIQEIKKEYPNLNIRNILAIPYKKYYSNKLNDMKKLGDEIIYVDEINNYDNSLVPKGEYAKSKLFDRNHYMIDNSSFIIGCWDYSNSGTKEAIVYSRKNSIQGIIINIKNGLRMEDLYESINLYQRNSKNN